MILYPELRTRSTHFNQLHQPPRNRFNVNDFRTAESNRLQ
jgi:hypothetical protein